MTLAERGRTAASVIADRRLEILAYGAILVVAAVLRLGDLGARGSWDADQGHDMLVLRGLVVDGRIPLLGPPTSIGDFHHGVLYYFLLAPAAAVSRADPVAVTTWIALGGVAAVAVTGWLARSIAGPLAGIIAALLLAVSSSAVEESIFIWNPNLIALSSSIALAAAWRAWHGGRPRWWVAAGAAAVVTMHCHVLGTALTPVIAGLLVADRRRRLRTGDREGARAVGRAALGWLVIGLLSYVPLAIHEIGANWSELRAGVAFVTSGGGPASVALPARIPIVGLRVLGWPLTGLITDAPVATLLAAGLVVGLAVWRGWLGRGRDAGSPGPTHRGGTAIDPGDERTAVRWLALGLAWTIVTLAVGASSLGTVVAGLPNDHYHAFADPMVIVLVAVGLAALVRQGRAIARPAGMATGAAWSVLGAAPAVAILLALVACNLADQPPARAADGGWSAARAAAGRVVQAGGDGPLILASLPTFKSDEALRMPLEAAGAEVAPALANGASAPADPTAARVVLCDQLFRDSIGADCGGPAEDAWLASPASGLDAAGAAGVVASVERFEAAPGRWVSVYRPQP